jgi:hypothetical protein
MRLRSDRNVQRNGIQYPEANAAYTFVEPAENSDMQEEYAFAAAQVVQPAPPSAAGEDPALFVPEPQRIAQLKFLPEHTRNLWLQAVRKELTSLLKNNTFDNKAEARDDDIVVPVTEFISSRQDLARSKEEMQVLEREFGFHYPSVIGCFIWLLNSLTRVQFAIRKLAKAMSSPGRPHFVAVRHLLHHIRCYPDFGITFYHNPEESPLHKNVIVPLNLDPTPWLHVFSDASFQDCPDTGRSTCGFVIFYQGGVVDSGNAVPDPVSQSSAEAEYCGAALACCAASFIWMLALELRGFHADMPLTVPLYIDNKAAQSMGHSFRDTSHTRHIARRWHYVRSQVATGFIELVWIPTNFMVADPLTKNLDGSSITFQLMTNTCETPVRRS